MPKDLPPKSAAWDYFSRWEWEGTIERIIGDAGYQGPKMAAAVARIGTWTMEIVRRCDRHHFVVLPKRWILEQSIGWISRNQRLAPIPSP